MRTGTAGRLQRDHAGRCCSFTRDGAAIVGEAPSDTWSVYLSTDDAGRTTELATEHLARLSSRR